MNIHEAILRRHSQRKYIEEPIPEQALSAFLGGLDNIPLLHKSHALTLRFLSYGELRELFPKHYKQFIYAPYYLLFYGDREKEVLQNVGYLGQFASLWLSRNDYASCWQVVKGLEQTKWSEEEELYRQKMAEAFLEEQNGSKLELTSDLVEAPKSLETTQTSAEVNTSGDETLESVETQETENKSADESEDQTQEPLVELIAEEKLDDILPEGLHVFTRKPLEQVLAFGVPDQRLRQGRPAARKRINALLITGSPEPSLLFRNLLELARMAPSEYNSQPWRFWVTDYCIHVFLKPARLFGSKLRHDNEELAMGCMLANLYTACQLKHLELEIRIEVEPFKPIRDLEYVMSLYISDPLSD
ncbi:MAG: nitroreductase family protein [Eubacteriales bacterium]|nr:nitroreductase family protein [Eubacteriales bacterium]